MPGEFRNLKQNIEAGITAFSNNNTNLLGSHSPARRTALSEQIIDSLRRTQFVRVISNKAVSPACADPGSNSFDPLRAAVYFRNNGNFDEAHWVAFLGTHFGKHDTLRWRLASAVYGGLNGQPHWTWARVSQNPGSFSQWLGQNQGPLLNPQNNYKFSNHRKYESLNVNRRYHTGEVLESYIAWIMAHGGHQNLLTDIQIRVGQNPESVFDALYTEMNHSVLRFGRLGTFDHICMLGKLDIAPVVPGKTYISSATGPRKGACLLIDDNRYSKRPAQELERILHDFGAHLGIGMQELEDSLCNWQKSPDSYIYFRG